MQTQQRFLVLIVLAGGALAMSGCDREDPVTVYTVPKEAIKPADNLMLTESQHSAAAEEVRWAVPEGWQEIPGQGMRYATLLTNDQPPLELTVTPLNRAGNAGELLANVNRWEQQLGLPPSPQAELGKSVTRVEVAGGAPIDVVDLTSPPSPDKPQQRMLAAIAAEADRVWYFKMVGPADKVAARKAAFDSFIRSISFPAKPVQEK